LIAQIGLGHFNRRCGLEHNRPNLF
jgi:hypothetical protein